MKLLGLAVICAATLVTLPAQAQSEGWRDRLDPERLNAGELYLELQYDGEADGFMRYGWQAEGDEIMIYDRTMWASREIYETMEVRVRRADLEPASADIRFHQGGDYYVFDLNFEPGLVSGEMSAVRPGQPGASQPVDSEFEPGTIPRAAIFVIATAMPLEIGDSIQFNWYAEMSNSVAAVTLSAVEHVEIDTPGGPFSTLRLEQRGGTPANDIFIDRETGHIVRVDVGGQPMQFLAPAAAD